jgi:hypothetical protein
VITGLLETVQTGGPWLVVLLLLGVYSWARHRGWLLTERDVDRSVGGYREVIGHQERELAYLRAAAEKKDQTVLAQADQIARLMRNSDVSAYALESILKEAGRRVPD